MTQRDERGYEFPFEGQSYVTRAGRHYEAEFSIETTGLEVRIEQGSGYMQESASAHIHTDILIQLLERAGFTVTPPPPTT